MKTKRSALKRFKAKGSRIKRGSAFRSHILSKMSTKRKRNLRSSQSVDKTNERKVKAMLGI